MWKEDVKKPKILVAGADVEITNVVLHWRGGKDDVRVVKAGGEKGKSSVVRQ